MNGEAFLRLMTCPVTVLSLLAITTSGAEHDPVFDIQAIKGEPLHAKTLKVSTEEGITTEEIEFTSDHDLAGKPIRTFGYVAYPKGGKNLPAIMWCQAGMADAGLWAPRFYAKEGYVCLCITLPKATWNAFGAFEVANPKNANLVRLAITHMRGITYLCQRKEVDAKRIGIGGSSYGGLYATLVAGADTRVKAGMAFFNAGNHHLGSNFPQFTGLKNLEEVEVFKKTADGATRLKKRAVPFLWGLPANDHWCQLPAMVKTYEESIGEKRMGILPHWAHAFDENMDNQALDWFDIYLLGTRKPYNKISDLKVANEDRRLVGRWTWSGENPVKRAELVVSYGRALPWHGWVRRYHHPFAAKVDGNAASAEIPIPEPGLQLLAFGNVIDDRGVLISTVPVKATPAELGATKPTGKPTLNACPFGGFEPDDIVFASRMGWGALARMADQGEKHGGQQSIRIAARKTPKKGNPRKVNMQLYNVYERGHRLNVWLKADKPTRVELLVKGLGPANWTSAAVKAILATMPDAAKLPEGAKLPSYSLEAEVATEWQEFTLDCPFDGVPVEGYDLVISVLSDEATCWVDDVKFTPQWKE